LVFDKIGKTFGKGARALGGDLEVIKWPDHLDPGEYVAWRYPKDVIRAGSTLIVNEAQRAIFIRDGKLLGILGPGRHIVDTQNVPFLQGLMEGLYGESIFKANIVFVNLLQYDGKFGDRAFIDWIGVHLLFNGEYFFTVDENKMETFYVRLMGVKPELTKKDITKKVNSFIVTTLIDAFGEYANEQARAGRIVQNVSDFLAMIQEFTEYAKARIGQKVNDMFGIRINEIMLRIDISDKDKEILQMSGPRAFAAMYQRDWTGRERIAESLSKSQGAGAVAPFIMMPWMMYPPQPPPQPQQPPMTPPARPGQQPPQGQQPYPYQQPYPQPYPYPYPPPPYWQPPPPQQQSQQQQPYPPQPYPQPYPYQQPYPPPQQPQPGVAVAQPPQQVVKPKCPYCGREIPPFAPVCPYCANPIRWCPDGRAVKADQNC